MIRMHDLFAGAGGSSTAGDYLWQGTRLERVRMAGNAVTPPAARDIVTAVAAAIGDAA